jgi:hypothetical protein
MSVAHTVFKWTTTAWSEVSHAEREITYPRTYLSKSVQILKVNFRKIIAPNVKQNVSVWDRQLISTQQLLSNELYFSIILF